MKAQNTVDNEEVAKFSAMSGQWWDANGPFKPLHRINPLRLGYIHEQVQKHLQCGLAGVSVLDIGCGGGLVTEPLARVGARVTGIDASEKNIAVAQLHAGQSQLAIAYQCTTAEALAAAGRQFDVVLALEIIEHVADVGAFVAASAQLVKPGGLIIYSTLNRTLKSFALAIVGAEYVLRWLPRGTHEWNKFLRPHELVGALRQHGIEVKDMTGMVMNPLDGKWRLDAKDLGVNYLVAGTRPS